MVRKKLFFLIVVLVSVFGFRSDQESEEVVTSFRSPRAHGKLMLSVRNDSTKFVCPEINVSNGLWVACDSNEIQEHSFFILRDELKKNWLVDIAREYNVFPDVSGAETKQKWFFFEERKSNHVKEDFTSVTQKTGVTYRHHESRKDLISYSMANPGGKIYQDVSKFHCQYDWEENVKGKYEVFYSDGKKKFRHKYLMNRFMTLGRNVQNSIKKSSMEITLNGTIEDYHRNGKKKSMVTYTDYYSIAKKVEDNERQILKSTRKGVKKEFYEKGKLFCEGAFGMKGFEGEVKYYTIKGIVMKLEEYEKGILNGKFYEYFSDGTEKIKGEYKKGEKVGKWQTFDQTGKELSSIKY